MMDGKKLLAAETQFATQQRLPVTHHLTALQQARLTLPTADDAFNQIALWVVAPTLAGFCNWIAAQAAQRPGAQALGVMREGRVLAELSATLLQTRPQTVWLNRKLSMLAAFGAGDDEALLNWLVRTRLQPISLYQAWEELTDVLPPPHLPDMPLDLTSAQALLQDWQNDGLMAMIRQRASELGQRLLLHWHNIVPPKANVPVLLLDFASVGNIQRSLRTLLTAQGEPDRLIGLNFLTTAGARWAKTKGCNLHGFLANDGEPAWLADAYTRSPELIEIFTAAPEGSLLDYNATGVPVIGQSFLFAEESAALTHVQAQLPAAVAHYRKILGAALTPDLCRCLWGRLLLAPLAEEVVALGDWPLDGGLDVTQQRTVAPLLKTPEPWTKSQTAWPAGSRLRPTLRNVGGKA